MPPEKDWFCEHCGGDAHLPALQPPKLRKGWGGRPPKKGGGSEASIEGGGEGGKIQEGEEDDVLSGGGGGSVATNQQQDGEGGEEAGCGGGGEDDGDSSSSKDTSFMQQQQPQQEKQKAMADFVDESLVQRLAKAEDVDIHLLGTCVLKDFPGHGVYEGVIVDATDDCGYRCVYPVDGDKEDLYTEELAWVLRESYKWTGKAVLEMDDPRPSEQGPVAIGEQASRMNGAIDRCTMQAIKALQTHSYWLMRPREKLIVLRALCEAVAASS